MNEDYPKKEEEYPKQIQKKRKKDSNKFQKIFYMKSF